MNFPLFGCLLGYPSTGTSNNSLPIQPAPPVQNHLYGSGNGGASQVLLGGGGGVFPSGLGGAGGAAKGIGGGGACYPYSPSTLVSRPMTVDRTFTEFPVRIHCDGKLLFEIAKDGSIKKGEAFTTEDEASLKFWDTVTSTFSIWWWKELVKRR